jgi:flagellar assembly protein FliH
MDHMPATEKFLFNRSFDPPERAEVVEIVEEEEEYEEPEVYVPTFSQEEMDAAREEGVASGREQGIREAAEATERQISDITQTISTQLTDLFNQQRNANAEIFQDAISTSLTIVRKCFPNMSAEMGTGEVESMIGEILPQILEEPRVVITVNTDMKVPLSERMASIAQNAHFDGRVVIKADANIAHGDCRIEWSNGGAERNMDDLWRQIDQVIEDNLAAAAEGMDFDTTHNPPTTPPPPAESAVPESSEDEGESAAEMSPTPEVAPPDLPQEPAAPEAQQIAPIEQMEQPQDDAPSPFEAEEETSKNVEDSAPFEADDEDWGRPPTPSDPELSAEPDAPANGDTSSATGTADEANMEPDADTGILTNTPDAETSVSPDPSA